MEVNRVADSRHCRQDLRAEQPLTPPPPTGVAMSLQGGVAADIWALLVLGVTIAVQVAFTHVLGVIGVTDEGITGDDIESLLEWRRHIAHDVSHFNANKTLAQRVCENDIGGSSPRFGPARRWPCTMLRA